MLFRAENQKKMKKNKNSLQAHRIFLPLPQRRKNSGGKVSSGTSKRGSLTVEGAFVLPLFFLCVCTLICFMDIYRLQTEKLSGLCQEAKELGMYAYALEREEDIEVPCIYAYRLPVSLIPLPDLVITNRVRVHPWTGYHSDGGRLESEEMVYVTETGGVYHRNAGCTYLDLSVHQTDGATVGEQRNRYGERYHACESCSKGQSPGSTVFVTDTGNRYHNSASCGGLKRTIRLIKISQAANMRPCSRCGETH